MSDAVITTMNANLISSLATILAKTGAVMMLATSSMASAQGRPDENKPAPNRPMVPYEQAIKDMAARDTARPKAIAPLTNDATPSKPVEPSAPPSPTQR